MSRVFLLDANVLIALSDENNALHARARAWFRASTPFATCPITQGALMRFHLRHVDGATVAAGKRLLAEITALKNHEFWPDDASFADLPEKGVMGHRQVTDAYLVLLARRRGGVLATLDEALAAVHAGVLLV